MPQANVRTIRGTPARVPPRQPWWRRRHGFMAGERVIHWRIVGATTALTLATVAMVVGAVAERPIRTIQRLPEANLQTAVADVRGEDRVASQTESPPSATVFSSPEDLRVAEVEEADRPPEPLAAPSLLRTADAPVAAGPAPARPAKLTLKRRDFADDEELRKQLVQAPELKLASVSIQARNAAATAPKDRSFGPAERPDYAGLPVRMGIDCQLGKEPAENLQAYSRKLRSALAASFARGTDVFDDAKLRTELAKDTCWLKPEAIPALTQMLMAESKPVRRVLVDFLAGISERATTEALAQRALFDLSFEIREAAVRALAERPLAHSRAVLVEGFRYPWVPVAEHAAEALVALRDTDAVPALEHLTRQPDPTAPFFSYARGQLGVRELVRINHLGNCTLCHAQSMSTTEPVRGLIPSPREPLPPLSQYYESQNGQFVRADVTYLRQDFSVPQPVARPGRWPANQRYDYFVRSRWLSAKELEPFVQDESRSDKQPEKLSGQREAVLYALRELREPGGTP